MNTTKKINVNFSSLVGLKAELLRKQTEVNEIKLKSEISHINCKTKRKSKRIEEKSTKKDSENIAIKYVNDTDAHKKSKLMLEAKAKLYDRLKRSKNSSDNFLVDFTNKSDESEEELLSKDNEQENDVALNDDDDWVEYEDCFGRTRKCLHEDLQHMKKKDELMKQQIISKKGIDPKTNNNVEQNLTEETKETEIEIMRRKWEDQSNKLMDKVNIHYQDILFDEARAHGVGYYAFSQDEEERIKQQENLFNLRKQTEQKQKEIKEIRELRENLEKNRLKAARIRQRIRAGLPVDSIKEEVEPKGNIEFKVNPVHHVTNEQPIENAEEDNSNMQCKQENAVLEKQNKIKALGELLNKKNYWYEMSQEEWVEKCRKSRISEFGPMYNNHKNIDNAQLECSDVSLVLESTTSCNTNKIDIQSNVKSNATESSLHSYNAPAQPISTSNNKHKIADLSSEVNLETSYTVQHDSNNKDAVNDIAGSQIKPKRSMDETTIEAGLRYLRRKFEENQNT